MTDERYSTAGPVCPYCDHQHRADEPFYFDEDSTEMECERCSEMFDMSVYHLTIWTTERRP